LQGREAAAALHLGARQDRAEPHHRRLGQEAARVGSGHQALALSCPAALCAEVGALAMDVILLERIEKLGQMGEVVKVKPGFARNYLLPQKKALRATETNLARFQQQRAQLEADNLARRQEAEGISGKVDGLKVVLLRQAGESGHLYGSVT